MCKVAEDGAAPGVVGRSVESMVQQLNAYDRVGDNIWEDVIYTLPIDIDATHAADPCGMSDVIILLDGTRIDWHEADRVWRVTEGAEE